MYKLSRYWNKVILWAATLCIRMTWDYTGKNRDLILYAFGAIDDLKDIIGSPTALKLVKSNFKTILEQVNSGGRDGK